MTVVSFALGAACGGALTHEQVKERQEVCTGLAEAG